MISYLVLAKSINKHAKGDPRVTRAQRSQSVTVFYLDKDNKGGDSQDAKEYANENHDETNGNIVSDHSQATDDATVGVGVKKKIS